MTTYTKETALYDTGAIGNGIDEAGETASKYITYVDQEHGIRVYDGNNEIAENPDNYAQLNSNGMQIYRNDEEIANFGVTTRIGNTESSALYLDSDEIRGVGANGTEFFNISANEGTTTVNKEKIFVDYERLSSIPYGSETGLGCVLDYTPTSGTNRVRFILSLHHPNGGAQIAGKILYYTYGTSKTDNFNLVLPAALGGDTLSMSVTYNGNKTFTDIKLAAQPSSTASNLLVRMRIIYSTSAPAPCYNFGNENNITGAFSMAIGRGNELSASDALVVGMYSRDVSNARLIVGDGWSDSSHSNAFVVTSNNSTGVGNIMAEGMAGMIQMFAGSTAPDGWLMCNGQAVSRSTYSMLFSVIGTTYGSGDGSTTFNVPDLRDRFPVGAGTTYSRNSTGGSKDAIIPYHSHGKGTLSGSTPTLTASNSNFVTSTSAIGSLRGTITSSSTASYNYVRADNSGANMGKSAPSITAGKTVTISGDTAYAGTDGNTTNANLPPYIGLNFIIATGKTY